MKIAKPVGTSTRTLDPQEITLARIEKKLDMIIDKIEEHEPPEDKIVGLDND